MRTILVGLPLLLVAAATQAAVLPYYRLADGSVDLVLVLTLAWTLAGDWQGGLLWGLMGGMFLDVLSGGPLGAMAIALVTVTYLASLAEGRVWRSHILLPLATALLGTLGYYGLYLFALGLGGHPVDLGAGLTRVVLPAALLNTLSIVPAYLLLRALRSLLYPTQVKT